MEKKEEDQSITLGDIWQDKKRPERMLVVTSVFPLALRNEKTGATHNMEPSALYSKFRRTGQHVAANGEAHA